MAKRAKTKKVEKKNQVSESVSRKNFVLVLRNLFLFLALAVLFFLLKDVANNEMLFNFFDFLFIICFVIFIALIIVFLVLIVLKAWKK